MSLQCRLDLQYHVGMSVQLRLCDMQSLHGLDIENGGVLHEPLPANGRPNLYYAPRSPGWRFSDIDWKFVIMSQHYGTIVW